MRGKFITFEGGEGSGKSTQALFLYEKLKASGVPAILTREPGGSAGGTAIRELLVTEKHAWHPVAETLLFQAARVQHWHEIIKPALDSGTWVICDRYLDSSVIYQGRARGLGVEFIVSLHRLTLGVNSPDLTFYLDIAPEIGLKRALARSGNETRFEALGMEFHARVRAGFLSLAESEKERIYQIDASGEIASVSQSIIKAASQLLNCNL